MSSVKRIICLANSWKLGERCIAGIDIDTGKWVRPVCDSLYPENGKVPESVRLINGKEPQLLDILEIPLADTGNNFNFESENLSVLEGQWKVVGQAKVKDIFRYRDDGVILHNFSKFVYLEYLQELPLEKRKTLQLINIVNLSIKAKQNDKGATQWLGTIVSFSGKTLEDIPITDPVFIKAIESGYQPNGNYLITMSLGMPYKPNNWDGDKTPCWKLIAGIIPDLFPQIDEQMKRLNWSIEEGRNFIEERFGGGKRSRQQLTFEELQNFLEYLKSLPNHQNYTSILFDQIDKQMKRLNWNIEQGRNFIEGRFGSGKRSRQQLTVEELQEFLYYLKRLPTPYDEDFF